jgi:hypothetical protein
MAFLSRSPEGTARLPQTTRYQECGALMNFQFFESLTVQEAQEHLQYFLRTESVAFSSMIPDAERLGLAVNYSLESLPSILRWFVRDIQVTRVPVPDTEPEWVRSFHKNGLTEFTEQSKYLTLRAAYYLGECFVRADRKLHWAIGNQEHMVVNMPVVTGFQFSKEMAPEMVCENLFRRIRGYDGPESDIDVMVEKWVSFMP